LLDQLEWQLNERWKSGKTDNKLVIGSWNNIVD